MVGRNGAEIRILEATEADVQTISGILDESCRWLAGKGIRQWTAPFSRDYILQKVAEREFHIINIAGKPAGVFRLLWSDPLFWSDVPDDAAYIHTLAVSRMYAGQGIGQCVIEWAGEHAQRHGKEYLRLDCMAGNQRLRDYYETLGFLRRVHGMYGIFK